MKLRIHARKMKTRSSAVALVVLAATSAHAEPMKPTGLHSEAKITQTSQPAKPAGVTGEVKQWARQQWRTLKTFWGGSQPTPAAAPRNIASQPGAQKPAAPAQPAASAQAQGAAPASENIPVAGAPGSGAQQVALPPARPSMSAPGAQIGKNLAAPIGSVSQERGPIDIPGVKRTSTGVMSYDLSAAEAIPKLKIDKEEKVSASDYALEEQFQKTLEDRVISAMESPALMTDKELKALITLREKQAGQLVAVKDAVFPKHLKGKVSREAFDKLVMNLRPEMEVKLKKFVPLSAEENRFLSGLLLYQRDDNCPVAIGLFHKLSKSKGWEAESNYYMAMCSKKMGLNTDFFERSRRVLETQDAHYSVLIMDELGPDLPYEFADGIGNALLKISNNAKLMQGLKPKTAANIAYILAEFGASSERYKTALTWAPKVPADHPKYLHSQFVLALAEYQAGSKEKAAQIQDKLINDTKTDKAKMEFQALVALNAARMHFQERNFKAAHENFHKVYKDHPLWLTSLTEMGWGQLLDGDYEGAIGNMYSIQSPFFSAVYKPESYVIRTIGYLNLCQYGDAYRTLTQLEGEYRPWLEKMDKYVAGGDKRSYYQTVRGFIGAAKGVKEVDGLPMPVVREMARHRDFTNLQKALNRQIDEKPNYAKMDGPTEKALKQAQDLVMASRRRADDLRARIAGKAPRKEVQEFGGQWQQELDKELELLNTRFFYVDLYTEAKVAMGEYRAEVVGGAETRITKMRGSMEKVLANRLLKMKVELARMLENNELLRYEVFAGSGENIRFQVAGGETGNRIPASVLPKSKSLQWNFDGEYWEDEIGHYRSSLKNNCPDKDRSKQASLDGGIK